jgi:hypothetical protein
MSIADTYRRHAADCVRLAQLVTKIEDKAVLLEMARIWHRLAERPGTMAKNRIDGVIGATPRKSGHAQ